MRGPNSFNAIPGGSRTLANPVSITGRTYDCGYIDGADHTAAASLAIPAETLVKYGHGAVYGMQCWSRRAGVTVQSVGDSILAGYGGDTLFTGMAQIGAAWASSPNFAFHHLCSALYGAPSLSYYRIALQDLVASKVGVTVIQTWSGNDISTATTPAQDSAAEEQAFGRAMHYGELVRAQGGVAVFVTAVPQPTKILAAAKEASRLNSVSRTLALRSHGKFVIDLNGLLGDGAAIADYAPQYKADAFHPNQAGHELCGGILATLLRTMANI